MVTLLFCSILLVLAFVIYVYIKQEKPANVGGPRHFAPVSPPPVGLFDEEYKLAAIRDDRLQKRVAEETLRSRANAGDVHVLREIAGDEISVEDTLYADLLDRLISSAATPQELFRLVSHVARDERLKVTTALASTFLEMWKETPERLTVAEVLHVSALSDDPLLYHQACETAVEYLGNGRLPYVKAEDLLTLIEGEYWILSAGSRSSGSGFVLKRAIVGFRRQLVARTRT
jgi:hypothetical protein